MVHPGLSVISADPKIGKSWFTQDLCISVALGKDFLGRKANKCRTLYLALEDGYRRVQSRAKKILDGSRPPDNFHVAIVANTVDMGLSEQIDAFMKEHPDTGLIAIDVLQRVRTVNGPRGKNAYELDSAEIAKIKAIADKHLCILLVHHKKKNNRDSADPFLNMTGSMGILGAADLSQDRKQGR